MIRPFSTKKILSLAENFRQGEVFFMQDYLSDFTNLFSLQGLYSFLCEPRFLLRLFQRA